MSTQFVIESYKMSSAEELVEAIQNYNTVHKQNQRIAEEEVATIYEALERGQYLNTALRQLVAVIITAPLEESSETVVAIQQALQKVLRYL